MNKRDLITDCERLESHIRAREYATESEFSTYRPEKDKRASKDEWWAYRCQLLRFMGRAEWHESRRDEAEELVLKALREEPEKLELLSGETVYVQPKCFDALLWFRDLDFFVQWLWVRMEAIRGAMDDGSLREEDCADPISLLADGDEELTYQTARLCYAACDFGIAIDREAVNDPPQMYREIDTIDALRILTAFNQVNASRLTPIPILLGPRKKDKDGNRPVGWSVFFSTTGRHFKIDARELMQNRSLASLLAEVQLSQPTDLE